jgi:hypothetical protein
LGGKGLAVAAGEGFELLFDAPFEFCLFFSWAGGYDGQDWYMWFAVWIGIQLGIFSFSFLALILPSDQEGRGACTYGILHLAQTTEYIVQFLSLLKARPADPQALYLAPYHRV